MQHRHRFAMWTTRLVCLAGTCCIAAAQPSKPITAPPTINPAQPNVPGVVPPNTPPGNPNPAGGAIANRDMGTPDEGDTVTFSAFSEPVELTALIEYVAKALKANISIKGSVSGQVVFNAPVSVPKSRLTALLTSLLEQQNFTLTYDAGSQFYTVVPITEITLNLQGEIPTTRVFSTPNLKPSSLQTAVTQQLQGGGAQGVLKVTPIDEMSVLVVTDTPKRLAAVDALITRLLEEYAKAKYTRIELKFVAAPVARERILQLLGQIAQPRANANENGQPQPVQQVQPGQTGRIESIGDKLTVDPQGNSLIFKGQERELEQVRSVVAVIDVANTLVPKQYYAGSSAKTVADIAKNRGLGEVQMIAAPRQNGSTVDFGGNNGNQGFGQNLRNQGTSAGGPVMVIDEAKGNIIYYGTEAQQAQLKQLIEGLNLKDEAIVIRNYKLKNADADKVSDLVLGLVQNRTPQNSDSPLLPGSGSTGRSASFTPQQPNTLVINNGSGDSSELSLGNGDNAFVLADKTHNQILVKAPQRVQEDYRKLIEKLDIRSPQVYIEAKIVSVTWTDDLKLAFESQLINANGKGGVLGSNFGLGTFGTGSTITSPKTVSGGLNGATLALIRSDQVPIVLNALAHKVDGRILSTPQLLVDDNVEGKIESTDKEPYAQTNQSTSTTTTGFGGNAEAGTTLKVKPQISEKGYLRLKYEAELSSFTGSAVNGLPPPSQSNKISADSVTVPSDFTVVVGGLTFDSVSSTRNRFPLLGALFGSTDNQNRKTSLYIFITPRIFRDDAFADALINTRGPQAEVKMPAGLPSLQPSTMEINGAPAGGTQNNPEGSR